MESSLGASVIGGGFSGAGQQVTFTVGLKGVKVGDPLKQQVQDLVMATLRKLVLEGFDQAAIDASMNTIEFNLRASSASPMKGMSFMYQVK